jgi:hypothetical protein
MIGILLALQVSNWNQKHNQLKQEHKILLSLKADFVASKERLLFTMKAQKRTVLYSTILLKMYEGKIPRAPNDSIKTFVAFGAYGWYRAELLTGAYEALINTGNSELIRNDQLTKILAEYFSILKSGFEDQQNSMNRLNSIQTIIAPYALQLGSSRLRSRIGLDAIKSPKEDEAINFLFKQDAFFGHLYNKTTVEELRYTIQEEMLDKINNILDILNQEIEQHQ